MSLYESVLIIRQDVSSADVDRITDDCVKIIETGGGKIVKNEYWELRNLAYEMNKNRKGHYVMLGIDSNPKAMQELERVLKFNEDVIRFSTVRVEKLSNKPSPILKKENHNNETVIDVTSDKSDLED